VTPLRSPNRRPAWALLPLAAWTIAAHAAGSGSPQQCAAIDDEHERLACYDGIFRTPARSPSMPPAVAPVAAPAETSAAVGTTADAAVGVGPQADFGLTEAAKRARDPEKANGTMSDSITNTVASVSRRPAGELLVTLENGQVWTQLTPDQRANLAVGDTVTIKKAALGSHLLVTESRYATRVRRVK